MQKAAKRESTTDAKTEPEGFQNQFFKATIGTRSDLSVPWVTKSCHAEADRTQEVN